MTTPTRSYQQFCPVAVALDVLGDRWTMLLVRDLLWHGPQRYGQLAERNPGLSSSLLSERLKSLTAHGLVERIGPEGEHYRLTATGRQLDGVIGALYTFGAGFLGDAPMTEAMVDTLVSTMNTTNQARLLRQDHDWAARLMIDAVDRVVVLSPGSLAVDDGRLPDGTLRCTSNLFAALLGGELDLDRAVASNEVDVNGDRDAVAAVLAALQPSAPG